MSLRGGGRQLRTETSNPMTDHFSYTISYDGETVADDISRTKAIRELLEHKRWYWCTITCWDHREIEEDGVPMIEWQKNGEVFLADIFNVPVQSQMFEVERTRALVEALQCLARITPLLIDVDEPEEYDYAKAVMERLDVALEAEPE